MLIHTCICSEKRIKKADKTASDLRVKFALLGHTGDSDVCVCVCVCVYTCIYIYIYISSCTHVLMHTCTYTYR